MQVRELIQAGFQLASSKYPDLHSAWVTASYRIGGQLPGSLLVSSVQRAGELDILLRCMEDEISAVNQNADLSFHYQVLLSELWVGHVYEILRLLKERKLTPNDEDFHGLAHHFRLLRIPLDKHEIPGDRGLKAPLRMQRYPPKEDPGDVYEYSRDDPTRSHIMPSGVSHRGSLMWQVIDLATNESFWIERRNLAERVMTMFGNAQSNLVARSATAKEAPPISS